METYIVCLIGICIIFYLSSIESLEKGHITAITCAMSNCSGSCIIKLPTSLPADASKIIAKALGVIIRLLGMTFI